MAFRRNFEHLPGAIRVAPTGEGSDRRKRFADSSPVLFRNGLHHRKRSDNDKSCSGSLQAEEIHCMLATVAWLNLSIIDVAGSSQHPI